MAGQASHFRNCAPEKVAYGIDRYTNEVNRLLGVTNKRLGHNEYLARSNYSIADMARVGWSRSWERMGQDIAEFARFERWLEQASERPAVKNGLAVSAEARSNLATDNEARKILLGQRAR
jgi:GST-like protein